MAKQKRFLGVDLGAGGIKVVELLEEKKRARLATYGWAERSPLEVGIDWLADPSSTAGILKQICAKARVTASTVVAALPVYSVFSSVINLVRVPHAELASAVHWEAKKLIPLPIEDTVLDWKVLPSRVGAGGGTDKMVEVLLTAASKQLRDHYIEIFSKAGLTLSSLETEAFAFARSLLGNDPASSLIIDIGAKKSNVLIMDRAIPYLAQSVDVGGKNFTDAIAGALGISVLKAESMKHDMGLTGNLDGTHTFPEILETVMAPLKNALQYSLSVYSSQNSGLPHPEKIILTGGSAGLPGLVDYFTTRFNIRTFVGDPWARVVTPDELRPMLTSIGPRFSVALGLAMRGISK